VGRHFSGRIWGQNMGAAQEQQLNLLVLFHFVWLTEPELGWMKATLKV
jgi:hypothetical protein